MKSTRFLEAAVQGAICGAAAMYFFDPARGHARRAMVRDRAISRFRHLAEDLKIMGRDLSHRTQGVIAQMQNRKGKAETSDEVLRERIRACLGHRISNVSTIEVVVDPAEVRLIGDIPASEAEDCVQTARRLAGKRRVLNELNLYGKKESSSRFGSDFARAAENLKWTPGECLLMCVAGTGVMLKGSSRRDWVGTLQVGAGAAMILRAFADTESRYERSPSGSNRQHLNGHSGKKNPQFPGEAAAASQEAIAP